MVQEAKEFARAPFLEYISSVLVVILSFSCARAICLWASPGA